MLTVIWIVLIILKLYGLTTTNWFVVSLFIIPDLIISIIKVSIK